LFCPQFMRARVVTLLHYSRQAGKGRQPRKLPGRLGKRG
jgi:hypothetical protein